MALSQYSPGVLVREIDRSTGSTFSNPTFAAIAGPFAQGPVNEIRIITSERQLESVFGKPNNSNFETWFSAAQYLQYGGALKVIRTDGSTLKNAVTNGTSVKIRNVQDYETNFETSSASWYFAGKTAGAFANGIRVYTTDAGADQILNLPAPSSGDEWQFAINDAVSSASGAAGKVYTYRIKLKLTGVVGVFAPGAATFDGQAGTVLAYDATSSTLHVELATNHVGILTAGDAIAQSATGAAATIAESGIVRQLLVVLNKNSVEFESSDSITDENTNAVVVTSVENEYQTREIFPGLRWVNVAPRPGTSAYAQSKNGFRDELHIIIVDTEGKVTGTPNTILERLLFLSKASDAKTANGESNYYKTSIKFGSNFIYAGALDEVNRFAVDEVAANGNWNQTAANTSFNLLHSTTGVKNTITNTVEVGSVYGGTVEYTLGGTEETAGVENYAPTSGEYQSAINLIADPEIETIDFIIPGAMGTNESEALAKVNTLVSLVENRKDCMVFFSPYRDLVVGINDPDVITDNLVKYFRRVPSTSYAVLDSGYKYIYDRYNDAFRYIPCAADIAGLCLSTAQVEADWYSPAGLTRGVIRNAIKLAYSPTKQQRDQLYVERVNPIVSFPGSGIVLFGDKTALGYASAFDRINVRRLFLLCEKVIANAAKSLLFELNDETSRATFINSVDPFLRNIQARRGLQDYLIKCDTENNTPESIDRGELYAEIYLKPTRTINYITLTFVATRTGISFSEIAS
jgi:phage tail sheath protein FI